VGAYSRINWTLEMFCDQENTGTQRDSDREHWVEEEVISVRLLQRVRREREHLRKAEQEKGE
jgi:hypothetical protein